MQKQKLLEEYLDFLYILVNLELVPKLAEVIPTPSL